VVAVPVVIGSYGVASKIGALIDLLTRSIGTVLIPTFSTTISREKIRDKIGKVYNYSIYFGLLFTTPVIMYIIAFSNTLMPLLFTTSYIGAPFYMSLIAIGILIGIVGAYSGSLMVSYGKVKEVFKYTVISSVIQFAFLILLVPRFYAIGLIISTYIIGSIVGDYLLVRYMRRSLSIKLNANIGRLALANFVLLTIFMLIAMSRLSGVAKLAVGIVALLFVYPVSLALLALCQIMR
jgi:O-antigen/teichoic acid export membrane protein